MHLRLPTQSVPVSVVLVRVIVVDAGSLPELLPAWWICTRVWCCGGKLPFTKENSFGANLRDLAKTCTRLLALSKPQSNKLW